MGLVFRHPEPGEWVGDYRILEKLGAGGFGTAFKAERAGLFFTVKFFGSRELGDRERREIIILLRVRHPCVARFRACDRWLDPKRGAPYIVMDFVPGLTLKEFIEVETLSARDSAHIILDSARTLGEVHLDGVFHRDLKPENIIIPGRNQRPVLIDFGVGSYAGAPIITPYRVPPGTSEYRSPEACRFSRANIEFAHYEFTAADELWALGVTFYWLLTKVLPFGDRNTREGGSLVERILHQTPVAPHVRNPFVPRALSTLCMRMLEKDPAARYTSVEELRVALAGALAEAELDESWDLPLFELAMDDADPAEAPRALPSRRPPSARRRVRPLAAAGLAAGVLGMSLFAGWLSSRPETSPPDTSSEAPTTWHADSGHEVAMCVEPLDPSVGEGAWPDAGSISAPVMLTMNSNEKKTKGLGRAAKALGTGLLVKTLTGCPAPQQHVRPTPAPVACPAGSIETMRKLRLDYGQHAIFDTPVRRGYFTVQEGETSLFILADWGQLPQKTRLSGRLVFGKERVFARLTEAKTPSGETYKVCIEVWDPDGGRGAIPEPNGDPQRVRIFSTMRVNAVDRFE